MSQSAKFSPPPSRFGVLQHWLKHGIPDDVNGVWLRDEMLRRLEPPQPDPPQPDPARCSEDTAKHVDSVIATVKAHNPAVLAPGFRELMIEMCEVAGPDLPTLGDLEYAAIWYQLGQAPPAAGVGWSLHFHVSLERIRELLAATIRQAVERGWPPDQVAVQVVRALFLMMEDGSGISQELHAEAIAAEYLGRCTP